MTDLDVRQLRMFLSVAESGTFTTAAASLGTSQPAVSRAIASLERRIGVHLVHRTTHTCTLTPAGQVLAARARLLLDSVDAAQRLTRRAAATEPRLIIAVKPDSDAGLLPEILRRCAKDPACPATELMFRDTHELAAAVRTGLADVAIIVGPGDGRDLDADDLWTEPRVAVLSADHTLARSTHLTLDDLAEHPVITWPKLPAELDRYYRGADRLPLGQPAPDGPPAATLSEALRLVELGIGFTFLPDSVARRFQRRTLVTLPVQGLSASTAVIAWRADSRDRTVAAFAQAARQAALADSRRAR